MLHMVCADRLAKNWAASEGDAESDLCDKIMYYVPSRALHLEASREIEAILNYLNIELRRLRSSYFKKYLENYQRALSSRDVEKYVDGEADVVDYEKIINEFALLRNKWLGVLKGLDQKQWQITNIVKLRVAGMEDATV